MKNTDIAQSGTNSNRRFVEWSYVDPFLPQSPQMGFDPRRGRSVNSIWPALVMRASEYTKPFCFSTRLRIVFSCILTLVVGEWRCSKPHFTNSGSRCFPYLVANEIRNRYHCVAPWRIELWWEPTRAPLESENKPGAASVAPDLLRSCRLVFRAMRKIQRADAELYQALFTHRFCG